MAEQRGGCRQVDHTIGGEAGGEQVLERDVEDGEDRDAEQRLAVERPGPGGSTGMAAQGVPGIGPPRTSTVVSDSGGSARNLERCSSRSPGTRQG
jgi:hypothetical protein